jgi:hypothetical protein
MDRGKKLYYRKDVLFETLDVIIGFIRGEGLIPRRTSGSRSAAGLVD